MRSLAAVLALLLLAGCSQPSSDPSTTATTTTPFGGTPTSPPPAPLPPPPSGQPLQLQQSGCQSRYGFFEVDAAYAESMLPEGFEAESLNAVLGGGTLAVKAWRCASSTLAGETMADPQTLLYYLAVRPPEKYAGPQGTPHWLVLGWVSSDAREAALFAAWNMTDAAQGQVSVAAEPAAIGMTQVTATAEAPGFMASYQGLLGASRDSDGFLVRYFGVRDGQVAGIIDIDVHDGLAVANGQATATIEASRSPRETPLVGVASEQVWPAEALSYTWTRVDIPA